jgi:hypothetical protein
MNAQATWKTGQECAGTYCGQQFRGTITDSTRPTPDYRNVIFNVRLHAPLTVFGWEKETIEIWSNSDDTIVS